MPVTCELTTPWRNSKTALKSSALSVLHRISTTQLGVSTFSRGKLSTPSQSSLVLPLFPGRSQTTWTSCSKHGKHTPSRSEIWERFFFPALFMHLKSKLLSGSKKSHRSSPPFSAFCNPRYDNIGKSLYRLSKKKYVFPPVLRQRINVHVNGKLQWLRSHLNSHKTERRLLFCLPNYHFVKSLQNCNFVREAINRKEGTALPHVSSYSSR